jgi:hypothetical protein
MRYHGQKEGHRHRDTKSRIARTLKADSRFGEPVIESVWRSFLEGWRRPDVRSTWNGMNVVFEAQVSNTYPQVVADRTVFFQREGALLFWIFDRFPDHDWRTLHADAFCSNQRHLFIVDEESASESERRRLALLKIYTSRPEVAPEHHAKTGRTVLIFEPQERLELVPFEALNLDVESQTASLFEVAAEEERAHHKILCATAQAESFFAPLEKAVRNLLGPSVVIRPDSIRAWAALVCAVESVRLHQVIGSALKNAAGALNLVYDHYPWVVGLLVSTLNRLSLDTSAVGGKAWRSRSIKVAEGQYESGPLPEQSRGVARLLDWLYPHPPDHGNREGGTS